MRKYVAFALSAICALSLIGCADRPDGSPENASVGESPEEMVLEQPPGLTVVYGETRIEALKGSYSWTIEHEDGTATATIADSAHPLDCKELMPYWTMGAAECSSGDPLAAALQFGTVPDTVHIRYWSGDAWGQYDAQSEEIVPEAVKIDLSDGGTAEAYQFALKAGDAIYEVTAEWEDPGTYSGSASYSFYTVFS